MPRVCITGDVHHDLGFNVVPDIEAAKGYIKSIQKFNSKATLFVTGKCIDENRHFWERIPPEIELGAHTYSAWSPMIFRKKLVHWLYDKVFGTEYGPYLYQYYDIWRTVKSFEKINMKPVCWRTHGYASNEDTKKILAKFGFKIISDEIAEGVKIAIVKGNLISVPINAHNDDDIPKFFIEGEEGKMREEGEKVKHSIFNLVEQNRDIVTQLHPICMKILDNFETFETILKTLHDNNYSFCTLTEFVSCAGDDKSGI